MFMRTSLHRIRQWWYMSHGRKREAERQEQGVGPIKRACGILRARLLSPCGLYTVFDQELGSIIIKLWSKDMGGMRTHYPVSGCSAKL